MSKIDVVYCPGSYGTYLAWAIYSYSSLNKSGLIELPFTDVGSAHKFWRSDARGIVTPEHAVNDKTHDCVIIRPVYYINYLANQIKKFSSDVEVANLSNWGAHSNTIWAKREAISLMFSDLFLSQQTQYSGYINNSSLNSIVVDSTAVLGNIVQVLDSVFAKFNLSKITDNDVILHNHSIYLQLQEYTDHEKQLQNIVVNTIADHAFAIGNLTIIDEAYVQHLLRESGYELRCHGLDKFPCTTTELRKLINEAN